MKKIKIQIKKIGGSLMAPIPKSIAELMDWNEGDIIEIPFHEIIKVSESTEPGITAPKADGKDTVIVKIGKHTEKTVTQQDVINVLDNPTPDLNIYRTAFIIWKGKRFGVKNLCKILFDFEDFNTVQGEKYLQELGFPTFRVKTV
ncbi:MAG: hypothetical protein Q8M95_00475 [Candidatus Methanoperedens sp.]|nr:hypothetical protein [Candidatus Methanoperedens sp.]